MIGNYFSLMSKKLEEWQVVIIGEIQALQTIVLPSLKCDLHPNAVKMTAGVPAITFSTPTRSKGKSDDEEVGDDSDRLPYKGYFLEDATHNNMHWQVIRSCRMAIPEARWKMCFVFFLIREKYYSSPEQ